MRGSFDWREDWVREVKDISQVVFEHVAGVLNLADIMTKCLRGPGFRMKRELVMNQVKILKLLSFVFGRICSFYQMYY